MGTEQRWKLLQMCKQGYSLDFCGFSVMLLNSNRWVCYGTLWFLMILSHIVINCTAPVFLLLHGCHFSQLWVIITAPVFSFQNQPLRSLRKLLHLSSPPTSVPSQPAPPPPDRSSEVRFQPHANPVPKAPPPNMPEARAIPVGSITPNTKSRKPHNYPLPGQIESAWHATAPYPDQMASKSGQNGIGFARAARPRMPNLNDLKETAL